MYRKCLPYYECSQATKHLSKYLLLSYFLLLSSLILPKSPPVSQQNFIRHLLCAKHWVECWGPKHEENCVPAPRSTGSDGEAEPGDSKYRANGSALGQWEGRNSIDITSSEEAKASRPFPVDPQIQLSPNTLPSPLCVLLILPRSSHFLPYSIARVLGGSLCLHLTTQL